MREGVKDSLLFIIVACVFLALLEVICYELNEAGFKFPQSNPSSSPHAMRPDRSKLDRALVKGLTETAPGAVLFPKKHGSAHSILKLKTGESVYDVVYHTDENRRRIVPLQEKGRPKHALLMGCSVTYGEGVEDPQTIPYYFSRKVRDHHTYNFGYQAYGINDIFARMRFEGEDYWAGVKEPEGVAIYLFHYDHMRRLFGAMSYLGTNEGHHPYLEEDENKIVNRGSFAENRPWLTHFYSFLQTLQIVKFFRLDFPADFSPEHWRFFARVVNEVKKDYLKRFPKGKFLVFSLPRTDNSDNQADEYLKELGIDHVDYSKRRLEDWVLAPTYLTPDVHYTRGANYVIAELLAASL